MGSYRNNAEKHLSRLRSELAYAHVDEIISIGLHEYLDCLQTGLNAVGEGIFSSFFALEATMQFQNQQ